MKPIDIKAFGLNSLTEFYNLELPVSCYNVRPMPVTFIISDIITSIAQKHDISDVSIHINLLPLGPMRWLMRLETKKPTLVNVME